MKLLYCPTCQDVVRLICEVPRSCRCGECQGQYEPDGNHAWYTNGVPIGFNNFEFKHNLNLAKEGKFHNFGAFMINTNCSTFVRKRQS